MPRKPQYMPKPKPKGKPQPPKKGRRPPPSEDDESVDSRGNIRDLIAYDTESTETPAQTTDSSWRESSSSSDRRDRSKKKSARGRGRSRYSDEEETPTRGHRSDKYNRRRPVVSSSSEEEEEEEKPRRRSRGRRAAVEESSSSEEEKPRRRGRRRSYDDEDTEEEEDSTPRPQRSNRGRDRGRVRTRYSEEDDEDEDDDDEEYDEDDDEDDEEDEDDYDEDDEEDDDDDEEDNRGRTLSSRIGGIELIIGDIDGADMEPKRPKKYKLSKEPANVRKFVKLVQNDVEPDEADIDRDIDYFKALTPKAQDRLIQKLEHKVTPAEPTVPLKFQILQKEVNPEVERVALAKYSAFQNIDPSTTEYYKAAQWIRGYTQLPLGVYKDLPVKIEDGTEACQTFVSSVRKHMDDAIYGHDEAKLQILQFVSSWIANPTAAGNVLSVHGPPGVGKTTLIKDGVAKALGRPFHFITLGGATDASFLDGHSYTYEGSTWGRIVDVLIKSKCMNPVIYFDELDKVSETAKGEEINHLLIHLTDGSQNDRFQDKYFTGIDLDLSRCLFIFSHNNHERVNPILRDRMYNIQVGGFGIKEKLVIAENYLTPAALREVNLFEKIGISRDLITYIIENFTGEEKGVRELKRCMQTLVSRLNLLRFYNDPKRVPFAIEGFSLPFTLKRDHIDLLLKKKPAVDESISHLYT